MDSFSHPKIILIEFKNHSPEPNISRVAIRNQNPTESKAFLTLLVPGGGQYDPPFNYRLISEKIINKNVFEMILLFLYWLHCQFKKGLRSIWCMNRFLWQFEIAWSIICFVDFQRIEEKREFSSCTTNFEMSAIFMFLNLGT